MATCRMFYQDNNSSTTTKANITNKTQQSGTTTGETGDENMIIVQNDEQHVAPLPLLDGSAQNQEKIVKCDPVQESGGGVVGAITIGTNNGVSKGNPSTTASPSSSSSSLSPKQDSELPATASSAATIITNNKRTHSSDDGDEVDGGGHRTNRRSLSSSFVTEEEDIDEDDERPVTDTNSKDADGSVLVGQRSNSDPASSTAYLKKCINNPNPTSASTTYDNNNCKRSRLSICNSNNSVGGGEGGCNNSSNTNSNVDCDEDAEQRIFLTQSQLNSRTKEDLITVCQQLQSYIDSEAVKHEDETSRLKSTIDKYRTQQLEASRRENVLVMRLTTKEQEMEEYVAQINELKLAVVPTAGVLKTTLIDPAINFIIQKMKKELQDTKKKLEDTQNDLIAWKFTPDSNTGKRLMAKCRMLYVENEELGKMINGGRVAKLETDLSLQKTLTEEMTKSRTDMVELVQDLDEDVEGMQSTIVYLQQQVRDLRESNKVKEESESTSNSNCNAHELTSPSSMDNNTGGSDSKKHLVNAL